MTSIHQLFDLSGRSALITGGAGYLGTALSQALAEAGASVVLAARTLKRAEQAAAALPIVGDAKHIGIELDHKNDKSISDGIAEASKRANGIDILVNNGQGGSVEDWTGINREDFQDHMNNAAGYFLLAREVRNDAVRRKTPASIIMIGSMYGLVASYPDTYTGICPASSVAYHTQKAGILQMTRHLAVYWAQDQVRVNSLTPGPFPKPEVDSRLTDRLKTKSPMRRMGLPHELKGALVLLASDAGSYITGQNLVIDGGWTAW